MKKYGIELLRELCLAFGPTGCEGEVREKIKEQIEGLYDKIATDTLGNLYTVIYGKGENRKKIMISSHMDEVGFMINEIDESGHIKLSKLGGIDIRVLYGKQIVLGNEEKRINGVIAAKAIHHKDREDRFKAVKFDDVYADIGTYDAEETKQYIEIGDFAAFNSDFVIFGENDKMIKSKALDDRAGCSAMIETMRKIREERLELPYDLYFCFTVREEVGLSGARVASQRIKPDYAIVLESTAIADIADVSPEKSVADVGEGGALSLMDRSTIYNTDFVRFALDVAKKEGIKVQTKRFVSGGNDAGHIHKSGVGVKCLALSLPTRYLHSPACVASFDDYNSIKELVYSMLKDGGIENV